MFEQNRSKLYLNRLCLSRVAYTVTDDEVVRKTTLREVKMLRSLRHDNIVTLLEAFRRKQKLASQALMSALQTKPARGLYHTSLVFLQYLVFEYIEKNLLEVLEDSQSCLTPIQVHQPPVTFLTISLPNTLSLHLSKQ